MSAMRYPLRIGGAAILVTIASLALSESQSRYIRSDYPGSGQQQDRTINGTFDHNHVSEDTVRALEQTHCREMNKQLGEQLKSFKVFETETDGWFKYKAVCR